MTFQPRHAAGTRRAGVSAGGRFTHKSAPDINNDFGEQFDTVGAPNDWSTRCVELWGLETTFTRTVVDDAVTVTVDCDDPAMLLLAKKGDADYWSSSKWAANDHHRRIWCADIVARMLEEGLVATDTGSSVEGIRTAMKHAGGYERVRDRDPYHDLTAVVALLRGLRLIESMKPSLTGDLWTDAMFGGEWLVNQTQLFRTCFDITGRVYERLHQPPWGYTVPWGPQPVAGHATTTDGEHVFVGEHGDLLWRALTETNNAGWSPLKEGVESQGAGGRDTLSGTPPGDMVCASALYDEQAAYQLTAGLFDSTNSLNRRFELKSGALTALKSGVDPPNRPVRWTPEQQHRLREFFDVVEALKP